MKIKAIVKGTETEIELTETMTVREGIQVALNQVGIVNMTDREYTMHDPEGYQLNPNILAVKAVAVDTIESPKISYVIIVPPAGFGG